MLPQRSAAIAEHSARLGGPGREENEVYSRLTMRDAKRDGGGACSTETLVVSRENLLKLQEGTEILVWS